MSTKLHLDVSDDMREAIEAYALERGITLAAAVRILLHDRLAEVRNS